MDASRIAALTLAPLLAVGGALTTSAAAHADPLGYAPVAAVVPTLPTVTMEPTARPVLSPALMWCWADSPLFGDETASSQAMGQAKFTPRVNTSGGPAGSDANITTWIADGDRIHYFGTEAACNTASGVHGDAEGAWDLASSPTPPKFLEQYSTDPGGATFALGSWWKVVDIANGDGGSAPKYQFTGDAVLGPFTAATAPTRVWFGNNSSVNPLAFPNPGIDLSVSDSAYLAVAQPGLSIMKEVCLQSGTPGADAACDVADDAVWGKDATVPDGSAVYWRTTVYNTGNLALQGVALSDPDLPADAMLPIGATQTFRTVTPSLTNALDGIVRPVTVTADVVDPTRPGAFAPGQSIGERYLAAAGGGPVLTTTDEASARTLPVVVEPDPDPETGVDPDPEPSVDPAPEPETAPLTEPGELATTGGEFGLAAPLAAIGIVAAGIVAVVVTGRRRSDP